MPLLSRRRRYPTHDHFARKSAGLLCPFDHHASTHPPFSRGAFRSRLCISGLAPLTDERKVSGAAMARTPDPSSMSAGRRVETGKRRQPRTGNATALARRAWRGTSRAPGRFRVPGDPRHDRQRQEHRAGVLPPASASLVLCRVLHRRAAGADGSTALSR